MVISNLELSGILFIDLLFNIDKKGLPEKVEAHTKYICRVALDIIDSMQNLVDVDGEKIVVNKIKVKN